MLLRDAEGIGEALVVDDFAFAQVFDWVTDVGVIGHAQNVVVGHARLLFCYYHIFAMFLVFQKTRKILMFQGVSALLKLTIFQKFQ